VDFPTQGLDTKRGKDTSMPFQKIYIVLFEVLVAVCLGAAMALILGALAIEGY
jgi:hypothetical protein